MQACASCAACAGASSRSLHPRNTRRCTSPVPPTRPMGTALDDGNSPSKSSSPQLAACSHRPRTHLHTALVLISSHRNRTVQPLARHSSLNPRLLACNCIRARARSACCSLLSAHLALRSTLSSLQTASNRHEQGGCSRRSATARPQSVRATSRLWARHV